MATEKESSAGAPTSAASASQTRADSKNMLPPRERRRNPFERLLMRIIATCGIVGIGVAIAAIMTSSRSQGWIIGLVVSIVSVVLAAVLWSSRQL
jgi:protein-S-isoprenylcysteine O-methyltransferase Ste14